VKTRIAVLCLITLAALAARRDPSERVSAAGEVDIVVNKTNAVSDLTVADAKKIFLCDKTTWPSGKRISVLMLSQGQQERSVVLSELYKMSEADYAKYFLQAAFTGKVSAPPKEVSSAAQAKQYIDANPGAIGYLKKEDVDDSVKVVLKLQ
jgi:ABC-type phosphate transport system substrate-binding protein